MSKKLIKKQLKKKSYVNCKQRAINVYAKKAHSKKHTLTKKKKKKMS